MPATPAKPAAAAPTPRFADNLSHGLPKKNPLDILLFGTGSDWSIFREVPFLVRVARLGLRVVPFALPAAVGGAWFVYPALLPEFKQRYGLP